MTLLDEIIAHKRTEVATIQAVTSLPEVQALAASAPPARDFTAAITGPMVRLIAEVKRASPAHGTIRDGVDPAAIARSYEEAGAAAVSVLTDQRFFHGADRDLTAVRAAVALPVLRKDFIVDPYQIYQARALRADAVLLIAGTVAPAELAALGDLATRMGMAAVFEVHTEAQVDDVLTAGARVIGINNRDLRTLGVDLGTTARLRPRIPEGVAVISESGIETVEDIVRVCSAGVDAVLVGAALMASADPASHLRRLRLAAEQTKGVLR